MMRNIFGEYNNTLELLQQRIDEMTAVTSPGLEKQRFFIKLLGLLDLTTLEGSDTKEKVIQLCRQARFSSIKKEFPDAAAVCVYPSFVRCAKQEFEGTGILVASVAGAFPSGQTSLHVKLEEIRYAIAEGADEIDTVISRGKLLEGLESEVFDELSAIRETCGQIHLKVILETGELPSVSLVRKASELAILAGADFIKTSTGKISIGATPVAFLVMLDTIREFLEKTGKAIGIKPAGGIRTPEQALLYSGLLLNVLGEQWFQKEYFRIGASSLAGEILKRLCGTHSQKST
ncbi:MAG: deoxyribose-phosphate aldolase [Bacteroidales bacterium]|nr:deoxyribose-phosphate aldolase [Bacteroidales bacterium]